MLLALDTSTSIASIALAQPDRVVAELTWDVGQRHSTELLQRLHWLLDNYAVPARDLDAVAVATGPGSFSGLRVALTTAKSLAFSLGIPLYGFPTLDVIAWGASDASGTLCAVLEAGRGQLYTAFYATPAASLAGWGPLDDYAIAAPTEVALCSHETVLFCGEWREQTGARLAEALGKRARFAAASGPRRASWLAAIALARIAAGAPADDPARLEPLYLRRPAITTSTRPELRAGGIVRGDSLTEEPGGKGAARALHR